MLESAEIFFDLYFDPNSRDLPLVGGHFLAFWDQ
jgi:hypothetical protein